MFKAQVNQIIYARERNSDASAFFLQIKRANKKIEAADALKKVVNFDPSWTTAKYQYGMSLIRLGKHSEALQYFLDCTEAHPKWISALYHLGACHLRTGSEQKALSIFKAILNLDYKDDIEEYSKTFEALADHYFIMARRERDKSLRDGIIKELQAICDNNIEIHGEQPWSLLYAGAIQFYSNSVKDALKTFEMAASLADPMAANKPFLFKSAYGCYSTKSFITLNSILSRPRRVPEPEISLGEKKGRDLVMLIGCDDGYFNRFSSSFLGTLFETNDNLTVHFHIIGNESSVSEQQKKLVRELRKDRKIPIEYSFENKPTHENKTYYALSRFIIAHQIMNHYKCGVVIGDIDAAVTGNLHSVKSYVGESDAGVDATYNVDAFRKFPWNAISGCYLYINNTRLGLQYAETMSHLMLDTFDPASPKTWWLDQSILYCATFYIKNHTFNFKLTSLIGNDAPKPFTYSTPGKSKDHFSAELNKMVATGDFSKKFS
ncbi:tetratricopeptide repeat protein [Pseudomonas sp. NPDC089396]|uniref:tetratricopeptide repeat protein n=1 Tax=Pseudomonas sp. NPDC089396 TaxID=3364461 RepID=UPI0038391A74